ncbi:cornifelin homolog A-like [Symsagittifera roscoffensis]|uniref:cornifelin homolog A-like n=1 Tax=Symsagittifera roscoffensis TaxID=84072 RepID=UPI00307BB1B4
MGEWNHGLFGCFDSCKTCLLVYFCPWYVAGMIAQSVGENCCLHGFCYWCSIPLPCGWFNPYSLMLRTGVRQKVRSTRGIERKEKDDHLHVLTLMEDALCVQVCGVCALCQEYNEMEIARK